jgi:hypothetical protein
VNIIEREETYPRMKIFETRTSVQKDAFGKLETLPLLVL